jgi:dihydroflavonol-4-reductase
MTNEGVPDTTVLVSGGSGFVASWCAVHLLRAGYRVRTTLRNLARADEVRAMVAKGGAPTDRLSFHEADLTSDKGWDAAAESCAYVMHVASPMTPADMNGADAVAAARDGALRVLRAAADAGARRAVMTSSTATVRPAPGDTHVDETTWTPIEPLAGHPMQIYAQSKVLAERAAWEFVETLGGKMELATVLPVFIQGPVLGRDYSLSVDVIAQMLRGNPAPYPTAGIQMVDVRDLADLHLRAMTDPAAAGERFIATSEYLTFDKAAEILMDHFGARIPPIPASPAQQEEAGPRPTSAKAQRLLGWSARPIKASLIDTAESLMAEGAVAAE